MADLLDGIEMIARGIYKPELNPYAGGVVYNDATGEYLNKITGNPVPMGKEFDDTKNMPDNQVYRTPGFFGRLTPQGQSAMATNMAYAQAPFTGAQNREQASLESASDTQRKLARAATYHSAQQANPWENEYLSGSGAFDPSAASTAAEYNANKVADVYRKRAGANAALSDKIPATVRGQIEAENAGNKASAVESLGRTILGRLANNQWTTPQFGINYGNAIQNKAQTDSLTSQAGAVNADTGLSLAKESNTNKDQLAQIQAMNRTGEGFESRYKDLGFGRALDTVTGEEVPNPRFSMQSYMGQALNTGPKATTVKGPDGKVYQIPYSQSVDIWRKRAGSAMEAGTTKTENTSPTYQGLGAELGGTDEAPFRYASNAITTKAEALGKLGYYVDSNGKLQPYKYLNTTGGPVEGNENLRDIHRLSLVQKILESNKLK